jgi:hypothetical protein
LPTPKYLGWKGAIRDEATGAEFDLDSDWALHPSKPQVAKNEKTVSLHMARPAVAQFSQES